ncbi:MAG: pilus assembly PilX N-terminal domain-containing protein [Deltaproteobacteria bacterium]
MKNDRGFALVLSLIVLLMVTLLTVGAMNTSVLDIKIGSNDLISKKAFYVAEAGWNEFSARFKTGEITDSAPANTDWKIFLAANGQRAEGIGYDVSNPNHRYIQTVQDQMDYAVQIKHLVENFKVATKAGYPVYLATSHGWYGEGKKTVEVTLNQSPGLDPPSALYSKTSVHVKGSSTFVDGKDYCGMQNKPGIITTTDTIATSGSPVIDGLPPQVINSTLDLPLADYVSYLKDYANPNHTYTYIGDKTLTGMDWGSLTGGDSTSDPVMPTGDPNIVYFNMNAVNTIKLAGGSHGEGILLVNGNLEVNGGFAWYGIVIATGALTFTGGGEKNVTGGVLAGNMTSVEVDLAGNVGILYCSEAYRYLRSRVPTFRISHWRKL